MKMQNTMPTEGQFVVVRWEGGILQSSTFKRSAEGFYILTDLDGFIKLDDHYLEMVKSLDPTYLVG